ncbi:MAG: hypothetical protein NT169_12325 [Chloroflexi bacterium]|nr:hypothetical protein [Chloroflexota bacterium]
MNDPQTTLYLFGFLAFFQLWGGVAIGAGARGRRPLPVLWGLLIGAAPLYFGVERLTRQIPGFSESPGIWPGVWLTWQVVCLCGAALAVGFGLPRLRALFLREGMAGLMVGTFIMAVAAIVGALFFRGGSELLSLAVGGAGFLFGAMWFGSGIQRLREKRRMTNDE